LDGEVGRHRLQLELRLADPRLDLHLALLEERLALPLRLVEDLGLDALGVLPARLDRLRALLAREEQELLVLREQRLGLVAVARGAVEAVLDPLLARREGAEKRLPRDLPQQKEQQDERDRRPDDQAELRRDQEVPAPALLRGHGGGA